MYKICRDPLSNVTTIAKIDKDIYTFFTPESPLWDEYEAWVAEGNTAEEWNPQVTEGA